MGTGILLGYYLTSSVHKEPWERYSSVKEHKSGVGIVCLCIFPSYCQLLYFICKNWRICFECKSGTSEVKPVLYHCVDVLHSVFGSY